MTKKKSKREVSQDQVFRNKRELFLHSVVDQKAMLALIKDIKYLNYKNHKPITLYINSGGGSCSAGLALINVMREVKSPIVTVVNFEACSMGSQISISGDKRMIVDNGFLMFHDLTGGLSGDYSGKVKYRAKFVEKLWLTLVETCKMHTKLTDEDLELARNGELWLNAEESLAKGCVDEIIYPD